MLTKGPEFDGQEAPVWQRDGGSGTRSSCHSGRPGRVALLASGLAVMLVAMQPACGFVPASQASGARMACRLGGPSAWDDVRSRGIGEGMELRASVFIATSLDGFIARCNGDLDWLDEANRGVPEGEDMGFQAFLASVDALVMGRLTFEQVLGFGVWPYGVTPVIVLSSGKVEVPPPLHGVVSISSEQPEALVRRLESEGVRKLYVDGGLTIRRFLAARLIHEITLTTVPVVLGEGRPLFGPGAADIRLTHLETRALAGGFVQSRYRVLGS